jgi:hypothetical protein
MYRRHTGLDLRGQRGTVPAISWSVSGGVPVSFTVQDAQLLIFRREALS